MKRTIIPAMRPLYWGVFAVLIIGVIGFVSAQVPTQATEPAANTNLLSTLQVAGTSPAIAINLTVVFPQGTQGPLIMLPMTMTHAYGDTSDRVVSPINAGSAEQRQKALQQRLVVKNADVSMIVVNPQESVNRITAWAEENGGWIVESNVVVYNDVQQAVMAIRVPAAELNNAFIAVKREAKKMLSEAITGSDVTAEYADAQSQLTNLESAESQLRAIMEKATTTQDVLTVYGQLTSIRGQIEQIKGRMQLLEQSAAYSLVKVTLQMELPPTLTPTITPTWTPSPTPEPKGWRIERVATQAGDALISIFQTLIGVLVWALVVGVPVALVFFIPGLVIYRVTRRRRDTNAAAGSQDERHS